MIAKLAMILGLHIFTFLSYFGLYASRNSLAERFQLGDNINYTNILGQVSTYDLDGFLGHLRLCYLIFAIIALIVSSLYYLRFESQSGSLQSRRGLWWGGFIALTLLALAGSLLVVKLPEGESWGISAITTPIALLITVLPYYLSTLLFCDFDAPGSQLFKNLTAGKK